MKRAEVIDIESVRLGRLEPVTRFVLEVRDAGSSPGQGRFEWRWSTADRDDPDQWRPSTRHIGAQLRRIADRFDPQPVRAIRRRHRVRAAGRAR